MKKILFDLTATQPLGGAKRHGGGKYGEAVLRRMLQRGISVVCYYNSSMWMNPDILELLRNNGVELLDIYDTDINEVFTKSGCNMIYSALPQYDLFRFSASKVICTVHGLRTLETPADSYVFKYKNAGWKRRVEYLAKVLSPRLFKNKLRRYKLAEWSNPMIQFVTVSNHSAFSIKAYFPELKDLQIPVFYSPSTSSADFVTERVHDEKYFLLVSGNRFEKNNLRAVQALDYLLSNGYLKEFKVKIAGAEDASDYRYNIINKDKFEFMGFVSEEELEQLYHDAYAFIYPTLNEGFGYPPLEAMHYGVPVLSSPFTSISEICSDAALYFNPFSQEEIAARILAVSDEKIYDELSQKSLRQYERITARQNTDLDALIDFICKE